MGFKSIHVNGVQFSTGNTKTGFIAAVSLPPGLACVPGIACFKSGCYALKAYRMHKQVYKAWLGNYRIAKNNPIGYFYAVESFLAKYEGKLFRWHISGDILDQAYLDNMVSLALKFKEIRFLAFTKRYFLDYKEAKKVGNLSIVFSAWPNLTMPKTTMPVCWVRDSKNLDPRIPKKAIECFGNCESCGMCWNLKAFKYDVVINKH